MRADTTKQLPLQEAKVADAFDVPALAVAIGGSVHEPHRVGEVAFLTGPPPLVFGRQGSLQWLRHRPGTSTETGQLLDPGLSREHLVFEKRAGDQLAIRRVGRLELKHNGAVTESAPISAGDVLEIGDRWVLVVHRRPEELPGREPTHPFGEADANGIVGEGPAAWALRQRVEFVARRTTHVLILGASGTGKELVARALHAQSNRNRGPLVTRSAATIPESLAEAELFGNLANYPNPGMAARPGLVGEADGGTLFLDEFGALSTELQTRLLRVLDAGEYTRLGEARARVANLRLVAATNRPPEELKHDVLARFQHRIMTPPLQARKEDIPLLAVHLVRQIAAADPELASRLIGPTGQPSLSTRLVASLVSHAYDTHLRELGRQLWTAIGVGSEGVLDIGAEPAFTSSDAAFASSGGSEAGALSPEMIQACLDRFGGRQDLAWKALGLSSRYVLARLVKKYGLRVRGPQGA